MTARAPLPHPARGLRGTTPGAHCYPHSCDIPSRFLCGALDSHPFVPSRAAPDQCALTTTAAGVPGGVASAFAEPSSWRTGGCAGCCCGRATVFAAHSPPRSGRPLGVSPRFRVREAQLLHPLRVLSWSSATCLPMPPPPPFPMGLAQEVVCTRTRPCPHQTCHQRLSAQT